MGWESTVEQETDRTASSVLVIGGTGGLGSAICRKLAQNWPALSFTTRHDDAGAEALAATLPKHCRVRWAKVDVRREADIAAALALQGDDFPLGAVVFAAGARIEQPFVSQIDAETWDRVIDLELKGFISLIRLTLPLLRRTKGALVTVGSFATQRFPPGDAISAVPKAGMEMLTRAIAREEGRYGIRANTVAPGIIDAGLGKAVQEVAFTKAIWDEQRHRVPLRRFGTAEDVAAAVEFLLSERASYITGQTLVVDGGLHI